MRLTTLPSDEKKILRKENVYLYFFFSQLSKYFFFALFGGLLPNPLLILFFGFDTETMFKIWYFCVILFRKDNKSEGKMNFV